MAKPRPPKAAKPPRRGGGVRGLRRLADRLGGARLCYGEPIREAGRTVVPVARVHAAGGGGWGAGADESGGGGGGGSIDARPIGFIEIGPEGARYQPIDDPEATMRAIRTATAAAVTLVTTVAGLRAARSRRLLGRGR